MTCCRSKWLSGQRQGWQDSEGTKRSLPPQHLLHRWLLTHTSLGTVDPSIRCTGFLSGTDTVPAMNDTAQLLACRRKQHLSAGTQPAEAVAQAAHVVIV